MKKCCIFIGIIIVHWMTMMSTLFCHGCRPLKTSLTRLSLSGRRQRMKSPQELDASVPPRLVMTIIAHHHRQATRKWNIWHSECCKTLRQVCRMQWMGIIGDGIQSRAWWSLVLLLQCWPSNSVNAVGPLQLVLDNSVVDTILAVCKRNRLPGLLARRF